MDRSGELAAAAEAAGLTVGYIQPIPFQGRTEYNIQLLTPDGRMWAEGSHEDYDTVREHIVRYIGDRETQAMAEGWLRPLAGDDRSWDVGLLPTFEEIRAEAYRQIGDVLDTLRSDWLPGTGPDDDQASALAETRRALVAAKDALNRAARR